jgi:hypothetical protein
VVSESSSGDPKSNLTFNLFNRPFEPLPGGNDPKRSRVQHNYTDSDNCVVERLRIDRGCLGKDKDDRDKAYPQHGNDCYRIGESSEVKGPSHEVLAIPESKGDWDSV